MPYALVPRDYILKKVSKQQEAAVKDYRKHEDFKTFLGSSQSGTAVGGVAVGAVLLLFIIPIIKNFLKLLATDKDYKGKTVSQIVAEEEKDPSGTGFLRLLTASSIGIPETLMGVVIPAPLQEEISKATGVDISGIFSTLRGKI